MSMHKSTESIVDWTPKHAWLWAAITCVILTSLLSWPAFGGAFLVNPHSDQYIAGFPYRNFAAESLRDGMGFPQWSPYLQGGLPYVAAMHGDIFYPTFLLRLLLPTDVGMTWGFIIHTVLAGVFTTGFLRALGLGFAPAIIGGVAYMLSGQLASFPSPGHDGKLFVSALLPLELLMVLYGVRDGRKWAWGGLALVTGLGVLSPHPQLLQYQLLAAGAFALFLAFRNSNPDGAKDEQRKTSKRAIRLVVALSAIGLGFVMGAAQFLPVAEYVSWSPRAGGTGYDHAISYSMPIEETINMWLPQFSGILDNYWGSNGIHFHSEYLGVAVILLAIAGLTGGVVKERKSIAWFWLVTAIITLFWAWGGNTPFYQLVYHLVPGSKYFRAPSTILYVFSFSVAVLAAFGTERLLTGGLGRRFAIWAASAGVLTGIAASTGVLTAVAEAVMWNPAVVPLIDANIAELTAGAWRVALVALAFAAIVWTISIEKIRPIYAAALLLVLVSLDLWSIGKRYWLFSDSASVLYASDEAIDYLKALDQPSRTIAIPLEGPGAARRDPFLGGSALMAHRVRTVLGYQGNELGRYRNLIQTAGNGILTNPNFWTLTNTQYLYTNFPEVPFEGVEKVVGPTQNAAGSTVHLYRLPGNNPYAWVVPMRVKADDESTLATILDPRFDLSRAALVAEDSKMDALDADSVSELPVPLSATTVNIKSYEPGHIEMELQGEVPEGATLVVSENYYPGWSATVDGQTAEVSRANYVISAIELPANAKTVSFRFDNPRNRLGGTITLVAILFAVAWMAFGVVSEKRRVSVV